MQTPHFAIGYLQSQKVLIYFSGTLAYDTCSIAFFGGKPFVRNLWTSVEPPRQPYCRRGGQTGTGWVLRRLNHHENKKERQGFRPEH
jgi:hypothetical protein